MRQLLSSASKSMKEDKIDEEEQDVEIKTIKPSSLLKILLADNHKIRGNKENNNEIPSQSRTMLSSNIKTEAKINNDEELETENGEFFENFI